MCAGVTTGAVPADTQDSPLIGHQPAGGSLPWEGLVVALTKESYGMCGVAIRVRTSPCGAQVWCCDMDVSLRHASVVSELAAAAAVRRFLSRRAPVSAAVGDARLVVRTCRSPVRLLCSQHVRPHRPPVTPLAQVSDDVHTQLQALADALAPPAATAAAPAVADAAPAAPSTKKRRRTLPAPAVDLQAADAGTTEGAADGEAAAPARSSKTKKKAKLSEAE